MRNKLTFFSLLFLILFVGKVGSLGTLGRVNWIWVILPLVADFFVDFLVSVGWQSQALSWLISRYKNREVIRVAKRLKKQL